MKAFTIIICLMPFFALSQMPDITGTAIDTSNSSLLRSKIRMESLSIKNDSAITERYFNRAKLYSKILDYKSALDDFNRSAKLLPNEVAIYYCRASVFDNLKEYDKAILDYNKVIELNPIFEWGFLDRGMRYF
jgi:tetratricopeptide (TPR) repeat protein